MATSAGEMKVKLDTTALSEQLAELTTQSGVYVLVPRELYNLMLKLLDAAVAKGSNPLVEMPMKGGIKYPPGTMHPLSDEYGCDQPLYPLYLHGHGPKKIPVVKVLRELFGVNLKEAKDLAETPDAIVWTYTDQAEAMEALNALAAEKAYVSLYKHTGPSSECVHVFIPDWVPVVDGVKMEHKVGDSTVIHHEPPSPTSPSDDEGHSPP